MNAMMLLHQINQGPWQWHDGRHDGGPGWWLVFPIGFGLFWLAVVAGAFYLLRRRTAPPDPLAGASAVLAERFARGEIDEEEYHSRLAGLRAGRSRDRAAPVRHQAAAGRPSAGTTVAGEPSRRRSRRP